SRRRGGRMSARVDSVIRGSDTSREPSRPIPVALLGVGQVGTAFLDRLAQLQPDVRLVAIADSRRWAHAARGFEPGRARAALASGSRLPPLPRLLPPGTVVVDATASDAVAARH